MWYRQLQCLANQTGPPNLFNMLTNMIGPGDRFWLSKVEFYASRLRCEFNFKNSLKNSWDGILPPKGRKMGQEDVWKRRDFGYYPPLLGYTKPNRFSKKYNSLQLLEIGLECWRNYCCLLKLDLVSPVLSSSSSGMLFEQTILYVSKYMGR